MDYKEIFELHLLALKEVERYKKKRLLFDEIMKEKGKHFLGIIGPRGVGKTVLLRQLAKELKNSLYISLDTLLDGSFDLFEFVKNGFENYKIKIFLLDEIHYLKNFSRDLKKIYDFLDEVKVIFTSSIALWMMKSEVDLSRRVKIIPLGPFSFREFLWFKQNINIKDFTIKDLVENKWDRELLKYEFHFENYLKGGLYPFSLEEPHSLDLFKNILNRVITGDIPTVNRDMKVSEVEKIKNVVDFVGKSHSEDINYTTISKNLGITKYKANQYVTILNKSFILNIIKPYGTNVIREPKILMHLPYRLLYRDYKDCLGPLREDFFCEVMKLLRADFYYLKSKRGEKTPDFLLRECKNIVFEIGGKGKGKSQFKGYDSKNIKKVILTHPYHPGKIPLFLIGMMGKFNLS